MKHRQRNRNTDRKKYLLEFAGGFVIRVAESHAIHESKFIRVYLDKYFNALGQSTKRYGLRNIRNILEISMAGSFRQYFDANFLDKGIPTFF